MSLAIVVLLAAFLIPAVAWANRPYERYRHAYEAKHGLALNPAMDKLQREISSGQRPNMLEAGPRSLIVMLWAPRGPFVDHELEPLRREALLRRNLVVIMFLLVTATAVLPPVLHWF